MREAELFENSFFRQRLVFLQESQWWDREKHEAFQLSELRRILATAAGHIPYYIDFFKKAGVGPFDFQTFDDLSRLPLVDKEIIKTRPEDFLSSEVSVEHLFTRTTGGSTGEPLTVYYDLDFQLRDLANTFYYVSVAGYNPARHRSIRLYGDRIVVDEVSGTYWIQENERKLVLSAYHVSEETCAKYVEKIDEYQPDYIHGRPSAVVPLCEEIRNLGLRINTKIGCVYLDGEILPPVQRDLIESVFGCRVYLTYGHTEGAVMGFSCPESRLMHMTPQVGIVELLSPDGKLVTEEGEKGEMVVTGFNNRIFPIIRYRTGDIGTFTRQPCGCGRRYPLLFEIEGRILDYVVSRDGKVVPLTPAIFNYDAVDWSGVHRFQVVQEKPGELLVKIVVKKDPSFDGIDLPRRVTEQLSAVLPDGFSLDTQPVVDISRTQRGKYRYLIQHLDLHPYYRRSGSGSSPAQV